MDGTDATLPGPARVPAPPAPWERWALVACLLVTLVGRALVAGADPDAAMASDFLQDDAFYYFEIAHNVAEGRGFTLDGVVPTNGFQPLYLLSLVPILRLTGDDPELPIRWAGALQTLVALVTCWLAFRLGRRLGGPWCATALAGTWALSPYFAAHSVNGMDTGSAAMGAVLLLLAHLSCARALAGPSARRALGFGAAGALAVLARVDMGFLALACGLDWIVLALRRRTLGRELPAMALAAVTATVVWGAWGVVSWRATGAWFPTSGPAGREIALQYGWAHLDPVWPRAKDEPAFFDTDDVPPTYDLDVACKGLAVFLLEAPLLAWTRVSEPFLFWPKADTFPPLRPFWPHLRERWWVLVLGLALVALAALPWRRPTPGDARLGLVALAFLALTLWGYTYHATTHWFFSRYFVPLVLVTHAALLGWLARVVAPLRTRPLLGALAWLVLLVPVALQYRPREGWAWRELLRRDVPSNGFRLAWERFAPRLRPDERVGAFQAGALSWFADRDVVNLDGKVNPEAWHALHDGRMDAYVRARELDYVFDWNWVVYCLYLKELPQDAALPLRPVQQPTTPLEPSVFTVLDR